LKEEKVKDSLFFDRCLTALGKDEEKKIRKANKQLATNANVTWKEIGEPMLEMHKNYQKNLNKYKDDKEAQVKIMKHATELNKKLMDYVASKQAAKKVVGNRITLAHKSYYTFLFDIPKQDLLYICTICSREFKIFNQIRGHLGRKHRGTKKHL
jgi:rubrerythrin